MAWLREMDRSGRPGIVVTGTALDLDTATRRVAWPHNSKKLHSCAVKLYVLPGDSRSREITTGPFSEVTCARLWASHVTFAAGLSTYIDTDVHWRP
jgi:hypothetical protein